MDVEGLGRVRVLELDVEGPPVVYARSEHAMKPDPAWRHVDRQGHVHEWAPENGERDRASRLPTLTPVRVHRECDDDSCTCEGEGWYETEWYCLACLLMDPTSTTDVPDWITRNLAGVGIPEIVEPGYVPDWTARNVGTPIVTGPAEVHVFTEPVAGAVFGAPSYEARIEGERGGMAAQVWLLGRERTRTGETRMEWGGVLRS